MLLSVAAVASLPPTAAAGQTRARPVLGHPVRITAPALGLDRHVGALLAQRTDTVVVGGDTPITVPLDDVVRVEVRYGTRRHPGRGAAIGFVAGAAIGAGVGVWFAAAGGEVCQIGAVGCIAVGTVLTGGAGAILGTGIGALVTTARWRTVPIDALRVHIVPQREGVRIGMRVGF